MVSIFASDIYSDTQTVSLTNDEPLKDELDSKLTFADINIDTELGGFTYVQTATVSFEFVPDLQFKATSDTRTLNLQVVPNIVFDNTTNLFADVNPSTVKQLTSSTGGATDDGRDEVLINIDKYVDAPAVANLDIAYSGQIGRIVIDGNQTVDIDVSYTLIGRQP